MKHVKEKKEQMHQKRKSKGNEPVNKNNYIKTGMEMEKNLIRYKQLKGTSEGKKEVERCAKEG